MSINCRELIQVISELADNENIRVTARESAKGAAIAGACSLVGGLLLGPRGLAIGGVAGSLFAYNMKKDSFRSLGDVIMNDLSNAQKQKLFQSIMSKLKDVNPKNLLALQGLLKNNAAIKEAILRTVANFVSNELKIQVID